MAEKRVGLPEEQKKSLVKPLVTQKAKPKGGFVEKSKDGSTFQPG